MARLSSDNQTLRFLWLPKLKQQSVQLTGHALPREIHPRVCGEHTTTTGRMPSRAGSSPRVRGTHQPARIQMGKFRFIPACAGNAQPVAPGRVISSVHPRVCGERLSWSPPQAVQAGSSPRVRGTPERHCHSRAEDRFIPACAGNASTLTPMREATSVHPRVCGERSSLPAARTVQSGSSPRVRGTLSVLRGYTYVKRFIPACAGNAASLRASSSPILVHPRVCGERN